MQHLVQFYEDDASLGDVVADFVGAGLRGAAVAVVVATERHRSLLTERLARQGIDVAQALSSERLFMFDAEETLDRFMVDGAPDRAAFEAIFLPLLTKLAARDEAAEILAYGEMVDVLWQRGNAQAALKLEEMWSALQEVQPFSLLCAYCMGHFRQQPDGLDRVCASHTHVQPPDGDDDGHLVSADHLRALMTEIAQRKRTERALRETELERDVRDDRTARLTRITAAIADAVTPEQVYEALVEQVGGVLGTSSSGLWLVDGDQSVARLVRSTGYTAPVQEHLAELPLATERPLPIVEAMAQRRLVWVDSQEELLRRFPHLAPLVTTGRHYSIFCVPILAQDRVLGALGFTFDTARAPEIDANFLLMVARYSGQALERLRLLRDEQKSRRRAELLYGLAAAVNGAKRLSEVFDAALDALEVATGTSRASILLFDEQGVMRFQAWRQLSDAYRSAVEGHSPWSRDTQDPDPITCEDVAADPSLARYGDVFQKEGIAALGFIPLVSGGRLLGKFMVYFDRPRRISATDMDVARAIAHHVAAGVARFAATKELQETVHFNEMFTGVLGHDLRNPLGAIMIAAQHAARRNDTEKLRAPLSRIITSGGRMARMIDQLLDFTRIRLGVGAGLPIDPRPCDLLPVIRQVVDELQSTNPAQVLNVQNVGNTEGAWDPDRLGQVFSNLIANAIQHGTAQSPVAIRVLGVRHDCLRVEVRNRGTIPADLLPRVFEPLARGNRRSDRSQGLGLGLYISNQLVKAHGGQIEVLCTPDQETIFTVVLPRTRAS